jgi:hypothetical protein
LTGNRPQTATFHTATVMHNFERMRSLIIIVFLTSITLCRGQSLNLVPVDSANFEIIADTLFDQYSFMPDSIRFEPEIEKFCPCSIDSLKGLVSYKSSTFFLESNKCLFIYKIDSDYFIRVGQMTNKKGKQGKYIWEFSIKSIKFKEVDQYISLTISEIAKAKIPRFESMLIVNDGISYTFGDIEQNLFATTPTTNWSDSVQKLINLSERLIRKNK